jgi:hypothetical protein
MSKLVRLKKIGRLINQQLGRNTVAVIGGYHGINLGDMTLGYSVLELLKAKGIKACLQTIYTLDKYPWPVTKYAIVGGGAIGYKDSLIKVVNRYQGNFDKVALLGVDYNEPNYEDNFKSLMQNSAWISCRNKNQAAFIEKLIKKKEIISHPDLAFSYRKEFCKLQRTRIKKKVLLINVVPLYGNIVGGKLIPSENYKQERPELYQNYTTMINQYKIGVRAIIKNAIEEGYRIESIPFTPGDESMAKLIMKDLNVIHNKYSDNPNAMLSKMASAEKVFATRYHATIFAFKLGAKVIPMAYAKKNEFLLTELGFKSTDFISSTDLANGKAILNHYINVQEEIISEWETECHSILTNCINQLLVN